MRSWLFGFLVAGFLIGWGPRTPAQDNTQALIDKAIKAHGGAEKLDKMKAFKAKMQGVVETPKGPATFTQELSAVASGKVKEVMEMAVSNQKLIQVTVFNGINGWISRNGNRVDMDKRILGEVKDGIYRMNLARISTLKDPSIKCSPLGETRVNDRPALGIRVSKEGEKDVNLYFDKETGLLAKTEHQALDFSTGQEIPEERIVLEYQDVDGLKASKKAQFRRSGKKFVEVEILEAKYLENIDDSEFQKP
jgi:hypothetical protein